MGGRRRLLIQNALKNKLPSGYTECEYLESTGTQYIDTGLTLSIGNRFLFKTNIISIDSSYGVGFGANSSSNEVMIAYRQITRCFLGGGFYVNSLQTNTTYEFDLDLKNTSNNLMLNIDGVNYRNVSGNVNKLKCYLFAGIMSSSRPSIGNQQKFWYFKAYDTNGLILDLIPCLDNNNVPCMYDTVSQTTFYNAGTGTFLYQLKS